MPRLRSLPLAVCLTLALAGAAHGQNLLANPDFDAGLASWASGVGTWIPDTDSGSCLLSGSAAGTSDIPVSDPYLALIHEACIPVDPVATPDLYVGALYRSPDMVWARLYVEYYSTPDCSSFLAWSGSVSASAPSTWNGAQGSVPVPPGAAALQFWVDFIPQNAGAPNFTAGIDRAYLGATPRMFEDGFEAEGGSTCNWSVAVP